MARFARTTFPRRRTQHQAPVELSEEAAVLDDEHSAYVFMPLAPRVVEGRLKDLRRPDVERWLPPHARSQENGISLPTEWMEPRSPFRPPPHDVERQEMGNQVERRLAMAGTSMLSCATSSTNGPATETAGGAVLALTPLNRRKTRMASQAVRMLPSISA